MLSYASFETVDFFAGLLVPLFFFALMLFTSEFFTPSLFFLAVPFLGALFFAVVFLGAAFFRVAFAIDVFSKSAASVVPASCLLNHAQQKHYVPKQAATKRKQRDMGI